MACIVMAYIVMAYIVKAYIVMAPRPSPLGRGSRDAKTKKSKHQSALVIDLRPRFVKGQIHAWHTIQVCMPARVRACVRACVHACVPAQMSKACDADAWHRLYTCLYARSYACLYTCTSVYKCRGSASLSSMRHWQSSWRSSKGMRIDVCADMCLDTCVEHVYRHVYRHMIWRS